MQPPELINMFAVPFAFSRHPDPAALNAALSGTSSPWNRVAWRPIHGL